MLPWPGAGGSGLVFVIWKDAKQRYDPATLQPQIRALIAKLGDALPTYAVPDNGVPDNAIGNDGDTAIRFNPKPVVYWVKTAGAWVFQGNFIGLAPRGAWSAVTAYNVGDIVNSLGVAYISRTVNTNVFPLSHPSDWDVFVGPAGRQIILISAPGIPASGERLFDGVPSVLNFALNLADSIGSSRVAAAASAVFSICRNDVQFGTLTFGAGQTVGTFSASVAAFTESDVLSVLAPNPADATLSGIRLTLIGYRG